MESTQKSVSEIFDLLRETATSLSAEDVQSIIALEPLTSTVNKLFAVSQVAKAPGALVLTTTTDATSITVKVGATVQFEIDKSLNTCVLFGYTSSAGVRYVSVYNPEDMTEANIPVITMSLEELDDNTTPSNITSVLKFTGEEVITKVDATYTNTTSPTVSVALTRSVGSTGLEVSRGRNTIHPNGNISFFDLRTIRADNPTNYLSPLRYKAPVVPPVPEDATPVTSGEDFAAALTDMTASDIRVMNDLTVLDLADIKRVVSIVGNAATNPTITRDAASTKKNVLVISGSASEGSVLENVVIDGNVADPTVWGSHYGLQVFRGKVSVKNLKSYGSNGGIIVNSSELSIAGNIDVSDNGFGGIEVSKSGTTSSESPGVLIIEAGTLLINRTEAPGLPTIWIDGKSDEQGIVTNNSSVVLHRHETDTQIHYYLDQSNIPE